MIPPNYPGLVPRLAGLAALNVAVLWVAELRRRPAKVSMLAVTGVALAVSVGVHVVAFALRGAEFAFAWGMLTVPAVWGLGSWSTSWRSSGGSASPATTAEPPNEALPPTDRAGEHQVEGGRTLYSVSVSSRAAYFIARS